ncbi:UxaA family hydrolase [Acidaminococcus massiliensis]|jgi:altronate dehydratase small subunit|uniref:UxaA family hydrolase n=1 Tax=Acidaminococcus massiliensis TaxID=1852375 RepID=UPI00094E3FDE|nr:UxaA family hydrolase [Acidaminococcus massiliensis]
MKINGLLMDDQDNVVTCVAEIRKGDQVVYLKDGKEETLEAKEDIPFCHKIALVDLPQDGEVVKYGELLGKTRETIEKGHWVSDRNIFSVPRDYELEFVKE